MSLIPCPKCGEKERYTATYTTKESYWSCQRCGYRKSLGITKAGADEQEKS